jgi:hypothetical protein
MIIPHKFAILLRKILDVGGGPFRPAGGELRCRCPAHDDSSPSLYLGVGDGTILIKCNAGCATREVCSRLDHDLRDLFFARDEPWVEVDDDLSIVGEATSAQPPTDPIADSAPAAPLPPPEPTGGAASDAAPHEVYSQLLAGLELSTAHFDDLHRRGLSAEEIRLRDYKTLDQDRVRRIVDQLLTAHGRERLLRVPGFEEKGERVFFAASNGYLIPVRDPLGRIAALKVRHDEANGRAKYSWVSSRAASCGNLPHVPLGVSAPSPVVRLTEGELKADVAFTLSKLPTVSAPGVGNWRVAVPTLRALGAQKVLLAMDRDGKPATLAATEDALLGLARENFQVEVEWWDGGAAKGVDDLLAARGTPEVLTGLQAAVRLHDALRTTAPASTSEAEPDPSPFPLDVLPPALARFCEEVAASTGTPPDYAGVSLLVVAGAALGNSRALCVKPGSWYEGPRIYAAHVGDPASGKTPVMDAVVRPYSDLQSRLFRANADARAAYEQAEEERERVDKENRILPPSGRSPLPPLPSRPDPLERLMAVDATVESLARLLAANPRGLLVHQDEGVAWVRMMNQYRGGRGGDRQFWLSCWSGKTYTRDRVSDQGKPILVMRPLLNVLCGLPPDMLNEFADRQGRNDGFLDRLLFVFPRAAKAANWTDATVSDSSQGAWRSILEALRGLAMVEMADGWPGYRPVHFGDAGKLAWVKWWDQHAEELRDPELPPHLIGAWSKSRSYAARLALVLHYLWLLEGKRPEGDLGAESVERAAKLVAYFHAHLRLVHGRLRQTPEDARLYEVLTWVRAHGGRCTARDLANGKKVTPTPAARKVLDEMVARGLGRYEMERAGNGRNVQWFVFDPCCGSPT